MIEKDKYLKFPGTKTRLNLGLCEGDRKLKEVRIKPVGDRFVIDVVLEVEDCGITPAENDEILKELGKMETTDDLRVIAIDPCTDNIAAVVNNFGDRPFLIKGGIIKSVNQMYNKELARLSSAAMRCNRNPIRHSRLWVVHTLIEKEKQYEKEKWPYNPPSRASSVPGIHFTSDPAIL
ncbi:MAG: hypothetical protein K6E18_08515 [Lachnospiraceae bacterium]|nr:hypothetical protein [Lachnospiraceae bacterium]